MTVYKISKWDSVFERAESRKLKVLSWVSIPTNFSSHGYQCLLDEFGDEAPAIYGAWCALVSIAASCSVRGTLANSRGIPLPTTHLVRISGFPQPIFERLLEWASRPEIGWLVPSDQQETPTKTGENEPSGNRRGNSGGSSGKSPDYRTRQDQTGPNRTQPDKTGPDRGSSSVGRSDGGIDLNLDWSMDDADREITRFRKTSQFSSSKIPDSTIGCLVGFGLCVGVDFLWDLASSMRNAREPIKKPKNYVEASIRKFCEEHGVDQELVNGEIATKFREFKKVRESVG